MSRWMEVSIHGERINGLFHLLINGIFAGVKKPTDPITFDPNFLGLGLGMDQRNGVA